jgi:quercetin dioxygenase-like cupin family protein
MKTFRSIESAASRGPAEWFTGEVWVLFLLGASESPTQRSAVVSFAAGARTAWHTHPRGQMLYVVSGICLAQREGGAVERMNAGDTVWFAPNERHWHGADPTRPMVHLAVQETDEAGEVVVWLEHVSDEQYAEGKE